MTRTFTEQEIGRMMMFLASYNYTMRTQANYVIYEKEFDTQTIQFSFNKNFIAGCTFNKVDSTMELMSDKVMECHVHKMLTAKFPDGWWRG